MDLFNKKDDIKFSINDREFRLNGKLKGDKYEVEEYDINGNKKMVEKEVVNSYLRVNEVSPFDIMSMNI